MLVFFDLLPPLVYGVLGMELTNILVRRIYMKIKTLILVLIFAAFPLQAEVVELSPCPHHSGSPQLDEGSGVCTGNLHTSIDLPSVGVALHYNSSNSMNQMGFGKGFGLSIERWIELPQAGSALVYSGNGTFIRFGGDVNSNTLSPNPLDSNHWLKLNTPRANSITELSPFGDSIVYSLQVTGPLAGKYLVQSLSDRLATKTVFIRDANGYLMEVDLPNGQSIRVDYYDGLARNIYDVAGNRYILRYSDDVLTEVDFPNHTKALLGYVGLLVSKVTSPFGQITAIEYTPGGLVSKLTDPENRVSTINYTANSVTLTGPFSEVQENFDEQHRIVSRIEDSLDEHWERDNLGRVIKYTDAMGLSSQFTYNSNSPLYSQVTHADGSVQIFGYNQYSLVNSVTTVINGITLSEKTVFNSLNLPTSVTRNNQTTQYEYDAKGNLTSVTSWTGEILYSANYNNLGQVTHEVDALGRVTSFAYDTNRNLMAYFPGTAFNASTGTRIENDDLGRPLSITSPDGVVQTFKYANALQLSSTTTSVTEQGQMQKDIETLTQFLDQNEDGSSRLETNWTLNDKPIIHEATDFTPKGNLIRKELLK